MAADDQDEPTNVSDLRDARTRLTPAMHEKLCELLQSWNSMDAACAVAGVWNSTVSKWIQRGATGEEPFASFALDVQKAKGMAESSAIGIIAAAATGEWKGDWKAAAWFLERTRPAKYGRRFLVNVSDGNEDDAVVRLLGQTVETMGSSEIGDRLRRIDRTMERARKRGVLSLVPKEAAEQTASTLAAVAGQPVARAAGIPGGNGKGNAGGNGSAA